MEVAIPAFKATLALSGGALLVCVILATVRTRPAIVPFAVAAFITAAYWFTASTSFANPAVTIARSLSDTFAGIRQDDGSDGIRGVRGIRNGNRVLVPLICRGRGPIRDDCEGRRASHVHRLAQRFGEDHRTWLNDHRPNDWEMVAGARRKAGNTFRRAFLAS